MAISDFIQEIMDTTVPLETNTQAYLATRLREELQRGTGLDDPLSQPLPQGQLKNLGIYNPVTTPREVQSTLVRSMYPAIVRASKLKAGGNTTRFMDAFQSYATAATSAMRQYDPNRGTFTTYMRQILGEGSSILRGGSPGPELVGRDADVLENMIDQGGYESGGGVYGAGPAPQYTVDYAQQTLDRFYRPRLESLSMQSLKDISTSINAPIMGDRRFRETYISGIIKQRIGILENKGMLPQQLPELHPSKLPRVGGSDFELIGRNLLNSDLDYYTRAGEQTRASRGIVPFRPNPITMSQSPRSLEGTPMGEYFSFGALTSNPIRERVIQAHRAQALSAVRESSISEFEASLPPGYEIGTTAQRAPRNIFEQRFAKELGLAPQPFLPGLEPKGDLTLSDAGYTFQSGGGPMLFRSEEQAASFAGRRERDYLNAVTGAKMSQHDIIAEDTESLGLAVQRAEKLYFNARRFGSAQGAFQTFYANEFPKTKNIVRRFQEAIGGRKALLDLFRSGPARSAEALQGVYKSVYEQNRATGNLVTGYTAPLTQGGIDSAVAQRSAGLSSETRAWRAMSMSQKLDLAFGPGSGYTPPQLSVRGLTSTEGTPPPSGGEPPTPRSSVPPPISGGSGLPQTGHGMAGHLKSLENSFRGQEHLIPLYEEISRATIKGGDALLITDISGEEFRGSPMGMVTPEALVTRPGAKKNMFLGYDLIDEIRTQRKGNVLWSRSQSQAAHALSQQTPQAGGAGAGQPPRKPPVSVPLAEPPEEPPNDRYERWRRQTLPNMSEKQLAEAAEKARSYIEGEPALRPYLDEYIGRKTEAIEDFNAWRASLPEETRLRFDAARQTLLEQKNRRQEHGTAAGTVWDAMARKYYYNTLGGEAPRGMTPEETRAFNQASQASFTSYGQSLQSQGALKPSSFIPGYDDRTPQPNITAISQMARTPLSQIPMSQWGSALASRMSMEQFASMTDPSFGGRPRESAEGVRFVTEGGEVTSDFPETAQAMTLAQRSISEAFSKGPIPSDPKAAVSTIKKRVNEIIYGYMDEVSKSARDPAVAREAGSRIVQQAKHLLRAPLDVVENAFPGSQGHEANLYGAPIRIRGSQMLAQHLARDPSLASQIAAGGVPGGGGRGSGGVIIGDQGTYYFPGEERGGGGMYQRGGGGLFRNPYFRALYSAYIMKRFWGYTAAPVFREAEQYTMQDFAPPALVGDMGMGYAGLDVGFRGRQATLAHARGQAAFQTFGGLLDLPYAMSGVQGYSNIARAGAMGRVGAGIAAGSLIGGLSLDMVGSMLGFASIGGPVVMGGVAAGAGIAGAGMYMEALNYMAGLEGQEAFGVGNIARRYTRGLAASFNAPAGRFVGDVTSGFGGGGTYEGGMSPLARIFGGVMSTFAPQNFMERYGQYLPQEGPLADYINYTGTTPEIEEATRIAEDLTRKVGGEPAGHVGGLLQFAGLTGGPITAPGMGALAQRHIMTAQRFGLSQAEYISGLQRIGQQRGLVPGTAQFQEFLRSADFSSREDFERMQLESSRIAQTSAVAAPYFQSPTLAARIFSGMGITTMPMAQQFGAFLGGAAQFGASDDATMYRLGRLGLQQNQYQNQIINQLAGSAMIGGVAPVDAYGALSGLNLTNQQMNLFGQMASGDLGAFSYQSYITGDPTFRFMNRSGQPIWQTDFGSFLRMGMGQFDRGLSAAGAFGNLSQMQAVALAGMGPTPTTAQLASEFFGGITDQGAVSAWVEGGFRGRRDLHADRMFGFSMAGVGVGMAQAEANRQHLLNIWPLQDRVSDIQHRARLFGFEQQGIRMEFMNQMGIAREGVQSTRMGLTQGYQRYAMEFGYQTNLLQRQFAMEDRQYQDQARGLQFGFQMEDLDEAIRMSSGRQRRQLVRRRDRASLTFNLESEQLERQRDRQEQLWSRQDERFNRQREHTERMFELDRRLFDLNVQQREKLYSLDKVNLERTEKDYKEVYKLQMQLRDLSRAHQLEGIEFQKRSLGIQAAAAAEQHKYQMELNKVKEPFEDIAGAIQEIAKHDKARILLEALSAMANELEGVSPSAVDKLISLIREIRKGSKNDDTDLEIFYNP